MHIKIISRMNFEDLENDINKIIKDLEKLTPEQRDFTIVKDVKITSNENSYIACIIFVNSILELST